MVTRSKVTVTWHGPTTQTSEVLETSEVYYFKPIAGPNAGDPANLVRHFEGSRGFLLDQDRIDYRCAALLWRREQ